MIALNDNPCPFAEFCETHKKALTDAKTSANVEDADCQLRVCSSLDRRSESCFTKSVLVRIYQKGDNIYVQTSQDGHFEDWKETLVKTILTNLDIASKLTMAANTFTGTLEEFRRIIKGKGIEIAL